MKKQSSHKKRWHRWGGFTWRSEPDNIKTNEYYCKMKSDMFISYILLLCVIVLSVAFFFSRPVSGSLECSVNTIEYFEMPEDVGCWGNNDRRFCPVPKDIACKGDFEVPVWLGTLLDD